jgi:predicted RNase H-like HicB family nuclease
MALELLDIEPTTNSAMLFDDATWKQTSYRCLVCLIPEEDGTWSAVVLNLPGAGSCGQTKDEALGNVREAITGLIESYTEDGETIPWKNPTSEKIPNTAELTWIVVNA